MRNDENSLNYGYEDHNPKHRNRGYEYPVTTSQIESVFGRQGIVEAKSSDYSKYYQTLSASLTEFAKLILEPNTQGYVTWDGTTLAISYEGQAGTGTVTSVALSAPNTFSVSGSPITGFGTLSFSWNGSSANFILADGSTVSTSTYALASSLSNYATTAALAAYQPLDADLTAISSLGGLGLLRRTSVDTWALDTTSYLTPTSNAATASKLLSPVNINGVSFDGSSSISFNSDSVAEGSTNQYFSQSKVLLSPLTGYSLGANTAILATDTLIAAFGKIQSQINNIQPSNAILQSISGLSQVQTGLIKLTNGVASLDSNVYALSSDLSNYQPLDADLTAIAGLVANSGILRKTAANTWSLDTTTYLTGNQSITISGDATGTGSTSISLTVGKILGITVPAASTGNLRYNGSALIWDATAYLTGNQSITWTPSGDVSGSASGTTAITPALVVTGIQGKAITLATGFLKYNGTSWSFDNSSYQPLASNLTTLAALGNPSSNGYVLSSNTSGVMSWIPVVGGGGTVTSVGLSAPTLFTVSGSPINTNGSLSFAWNGSNLNFVLADGSTVSTSTYALASALSSYLTTATASSTYLTISTASTTYQPLDGDLTSIAGLSGTSGFAKKTAANTWTLDTNTYLTTNQSITWTGSGDVSGTASGATAISPSITVTGIRGKSITLASGLLRYNGTAFSFDSSAYLTANQSITLSGDVSGSGATAITVAVNKILGNSIPANATGALTNNGTGTLSWVSYLTTAPTITLTGDVTGSGTGSFATTIASSVITGKLLTGYSVGANTAIAATDSILVAFQKIQGQINNRISLTSLSATSPILYNNSTGVISHASTDGNLHVPATSTTNNGKVLTAGATAGSLSWTTPTTGTVTSVGLTAPSIFTVSGSPVTSSGSLTFAFNGSSANFLLANGSTIPTANYALAAEYLPLAGGTMTGSITSPTPNNILNPTSYNYIPTDNSPFTQSSIISYGSHDWSAYTAPVQEKTADGTTWVADTLATKLFDAYPSPTSVQVINMATPLLGTRWTWNDVTWSFINKALITYSFSGAIPTGFTQTVETSPDGTTWTNVGTSTGYSSFSPIIFSIPTVGVNPWLRVTVKATGGSGSIMCNSVQLWSTHLGDQGKSKWNYLPFSWDYNKLVTYTSIKIGSLNGILKATGGVVSVATAGTDYLTANQTITLSGDVTGSGTTAITTSISAATVTGKLLTGYVVGSNTALAAADTILAAFGKIQAQINARGVGSVTSVGLSTPTIFTVSNSPVTGAGTLTFAWNGSSSNLVRADGSTIAASTYQTAATNLSTLAALGNPASNGYVLSSTTAGVMSWIPVSGGGGTVTSIGLSAPSIFTVSGSPVTTAGTLSFAWNGASTNFVLGDGTTTAVSGFLTTSAASSTYQPLDADLTSIAGLAGTTGWLKKTAANTWALDTSTFLTANQSITWAGSGDISGSASGTTSISPSITVTGIQGKSITLASGLLRYNGTAFSFDSNTYLTTNQSITLSGDTSGSGTTAITVTVNKILGNSIPANAAGALTNNGTGTLSWVSYLTTAPTITLTGDVTGSGTGSFATSITAATVTGKALTGYTLGTNAVLAATDTILAAFGKVQAQINAKGTGTITSVALSAPSIFTVSGSPVTSSGTLSFAWNGASSNLVRADGTTVAQSTFLTANQSITLSGAVTGTGTTAIATTLSASAVGLLNMANLAANSVIGNLTGSAATPVAVSATAAATASTVMVRNSSGNSLVNNLILGYQAFASNGGTYVIGAVTKPNLRVTGTLNQYVKMPDPTTVPLGISYHIRNDSTGVITVQSDNNDEIVSISSGAECVLTCILASGTTAASWSYFYNGSVVASGKKLTVSNSLTLAGTDATTMTFPSTSATIARIDAAQTFTGNQTFSGRQLSLYAGSTSSLPTTSSVLISSTLPSIVLQNASGVTDGKNWGIHAESSIFYITALNDVGDNYATVLSAGRSGSTLSSVKLGHAGSTLNLGAFFSGTTSGILQAAATGNVTRLSPPSTDGYVLASTTAGVLSWVAPGTGGMANPMTTTGDMIYSSSGSTPARLAVGTASQVLIGGTTPTWSSTLTLGGKLTVPASTTGSAGFSLQQGTAPTVPGNGDFWITSAGVYAQVAGSTLKLNSNGALYYSSTTSIYITNTTTAGSLGSTSLASAAMTPGNVISVQADGYVKYNTLSDTVTVAVRIAGTDVSFTVVGSSVPSGVVNTNYHWYINGRLMPSTGPGAGSSLKFFGRFVVVGTGAEYVSDITQTLTADTSSAITFDLRAQWSGTGANNSIGSEYLVVQQINSIGGGGGAVMSVALSAPSLFTVTGSPITSSGVLGFAWNGSSSNLVRADGSVVAASSYQAASTALANFAALGNPSTNGYVLSSTTAGVLSWVAGGSGGFIGTTTNGVAYYDGTALTNSSNLTYNGSYITSQGASFGVNTSLSGWAWFGSSAFGGAANYPGFWQSHTTGELGLWAATGTQISFAEATVGNIARLNAGGLYPETDNTFSLGTSAKAWAAAYAVSGRFNNTVLGNLSTVTSGVTTALTAASPQVIEFTGSTASHKCSLPDTTNLSIGRRFEIYNNATVPVLIQNSDLTSIITVSASSSVTVICKAQTGAVGDWIVDDKLALSGGTITGQIYGITATAAPLIDVRTSYPGLDNSAIRAEATGAGGQAIYARSSVDNAYGIWAHAVTGINSVALYAIASDGATAIKAVCDGSGYAGTFTGNVRITGTTTLNTSMTGVLQATSGVISTIDSSAFVRSDTINTFTVDQKFNANVYYGSGTLTAIPAAPLNMLASAAATMKTQLNLINTGGNAGAGACIDFYTYDVAGMTNPGMRIGALDNSYSADFVLYIKTPNSPTGALVERFRVTNSGVGTLPGGLTCTTGKLGYSTGAGGTVTQATSKSTGVTLNKQCGNITMNGAALANAATVTFTLTNSFITANDMVVVRHRSAGTLGAYNIAVAPAAGSCTISVRNVHTASLSEAIVLQFFVLSAVVA